MVKYFYLIVYISLFSLPLHASKDTKKIDDMLTHAFNLLNSNNDSAKFYAEKALDLSLKTQYKKGQASAYMRLAVVMSNFGKADSALFLLRKAATIRAQLNDKKGCAGAYREISYIYKRKIILFLSYIRMDCLFTSWKSTFLTCFLALVILIRFIV